MGLNKEVNITNLIEILEICKFSRNQNRENVKLLKNAEQNKVFFLQ